jgi:hypothetical protein
MSRIERVLPLFPVQVLTAVGVSITADLVLFKYLNSDVLSQRLLRNVAWISAGPAATVALSGCYSRDAAVIALLAAALVGTGLALYSHSYCLENHAMKFSWPEGILTELSSTLILAMVAAPAIVCAPTPR